MRRPAGPSRSHVDHTRVCFGIGYEFGNSLRRERWTYFHDQGAAAEDGDRRHVAREIEVEIGIERDIDGVRNASEKQSVAVGRGVNCNICTYTPRGAEPIVDDKRLAEMFGQLFPDEARQYIAKTSGRITN